MNYGEMTLIERHDALRQTVDELRAELAASQQVIANLMEQFEAKLFALSDRAREREDIEGSRMLIALIADLRSWYRRDVDDRYTRYSDLLQKWNTFSNGTIEEERARQKELIRDARARMLRAIAVDPHWNGTYADLVALFKE